jgi:putative transposase
MLTVVHDAESSNDDAGAGRSLLDEIVRDGARRMLEAALQAEVAAYVEQFIDQVDDNGRRLVVRNGYHQQRDVLTAAGAVAVKAPRVNDKRVDPDSGERQRYSSAILPAWARKSPQMTEVLPLLYLHGLSTSDFGPALERFLGSGAGSRRRRSPGSPRSGKTRPTPSGSATCPAPITSTYGSTGSTSKCASNSRNCACW